MEPYFKAEWLSQEVDSLVPVAEKKKKEKQALSVEPPDLQYVHAFGFEKPGDYY